MQMKYIILKADDFQYDSKKSISISWLRFLNYVIENNLSACLGVIGNTIKKANDKFLYQVNDIEKSGNFELFNHGYNHFLGKWFLKSISEFKNTPLWYQQKNILKTQDIGKSELGIIFRTFGAPGNAIDHNTKTALERNNELEVWFFGIQPSTQFVLNRYTNAEYPTSNPNFIRFKESFKNERDYTVLQLHPHSWDKNQFNEFKKIINYFKEKQESFRFITAYNYFLKVQRIYN